MHFIFRDGYVVKVLGEVCTFFKFCLYGKIGLIFKPDTIIINHQLELSRTRVKYLDHEKSAYKHAIWSYRISEKAYYNHLFWRVQRDWMSKSCLESSSTCILCLCEKRKPWRGHVYMQARRRLL